MHITFLLIIYSEYVYNSLESRGNAVVCTPPDGRLAALIQFFIGFWGGGV